MDRLGNNAVGVGKWPYYGERGVSHFFIIGSLEPCLQGRRDAACLTRPHVTPRYHAVLAITDKDSRQGYQLP